MRAKTVLFVVLSTVFFTNTVMCDYPWSSSVKVTNVQTNEPSIAVHYPNIYIAYVKWSGSSLDGVRFMHSTDAGLSWSQEKIFDSICCDPSLHISENGKLHLSMLGQEQFIQYYSSTDQGFTWSQKQNLNSPDPDKCWTFAKNNRVYVTWVGNSGRNVWFTKSTDYGTTFSTHIEISGSSNSGSRWFPIPLEDPKDSNIIYCLMSCDSRDGSGVPLKPYVAKSTNGGSNWLQNVPVPDTVTGGILGCGSLPYSRNSSIAVSPLYNDVYIAFTGKNNEFTGASPSVYFSKSTDGGSTFSQRKKIPIADSSFHFMPWINCDVYGNIHTVWYDTRGYTAGNSFGSKNTYYTYSTDRGETWADEEKISDSTDTYNFTSFGHYFQMTTDSFRIYNAWCERRTTLNNERIYFAWRWLPYIVGINPPEEVPHNFALYQNYPNPFNPATTVAFDLPDESLVTLAIYDLLGRELFVIFSKNLQVGRYSYKLDNLDLPSSVYFYQVRTEKFSITKKMVLIK